MRLGLSINKIYKITPGFNPPSEPESQIGTQVPGQAGIIYYTETVDGVTTNYETISTYQVLLPMLQSGGSPSYNYYDLDNEATTFKTSLPQLLGYIANGTLTVNSTVYDNWELLTIPANTPEDLRNEIITNWIYAVQSFIAPGEIEFGVLIKIGDKYNVIQNLVNISSIQFNLIELTFNANGYIISDETYPLVPAVVRTFIPTTTATTKVPLLLSGMTLVDSTATSAVGVPIPAINIASLSDYLSLIELEGAIADQTIMSQSPRYPIANTYLDPVTTPASTYPNSTKPPENTQIYPGPFDNISASVSIANQSIVVIINSYTTQAPPEPWYYALNGNVNNKNLKLKCEVTCWGNKFTIDTTGIVPLFLKRSQFTSVTGTRISSQLAGKYFEGWKFVINLQDLNIFPTIVNNQVVTNTVQQKSFDGTEGTFKAGVFSIGSITFTADDYLESDIMYSISSGYFVTVPMFKGGAFEPGQDLSLFLAPASSTDDQTVLNKNRTTANAIPSTLPTITASNNANGLRPLITG